MLIVHAGNRIDAPGRSQRRFPDEQVGSVRATVAALLGVLRPTMVVGAAAAGADLIVLAAAQTLQIPVRVLIPTTRDAFVRDSVADNGREWVGEFERVVGHALDDPASDVVESANTGHGVPTEERWLAANVTLLQWAAELARDNALSALALTIRPLPEGVPPSVTDHFARIAEEAGLVVLTLDPRHDGRDVRVGPASPALVPFA